MNEIEPITVLPTRDNATVAWSTPDRETTSWFVPEQKECRWKEHAFTQKDANTSLLRCWMSIAHHDPIKVWIRRWPEIRKEHDFESDRTVYYIFARWTVLS